MDTARDYAVWIAAIAAGLAAAGYLFRLVRSLFRRITAIQRLVERELTHNHGSSMKDDLYGMAVTMGELHRKTDDIDHRLKRVERGR